MKTRNKATTRQTMNGIMKQDREEVPPSSRDNNGAENIPPRVAAIKKDTVGKAGGLQQAGAGIVVKTIR